MMLITLYLCLCGLEWSHNRRIHCCRSITRSYYRNSVGALLVYDITKRRSFEHLEDWLDEAQMHIEPHKAVYMVIGHKADRDEERAVTYKEGKHFAEFHGLRFLETSAKTGQNIEEAFQLITRDIHEMLEKGQLKIEDGWDGIKNGYAQTRETLTLEEGEPQESGCCWFHPLRAVECDLWSIYWAFCDP